jgi:hypothetical protein
MSRDDGMSWRAMAPGQTRKVHTEQPFQAAGKWGTGRSLLRGSLVAESCFRLSAAQRYTCAGARVKKRALKAWHPSVRAQDATRLRRSGARSIAERTRILALRGMRAREKRLDGAGREFRASVCFPPCDTVREEAAHEGRADWPRESSGTGVRCRSAGVRVRALPQPSCRSCIREG